MNPCGQKGGMTQPPPARTRTTNRCSYNGALKKRGSLLIGRDKEMTWLAPHEGRPGRQTAEIQIRVLRRLSRTNGVRLLNHEPLLRPRHRRDRPPGLNPKGKAEVTPQASVVQQLGAPPRFGAARLPSRRASG